MDCSSREGGFDDAAATSLLNWQCGEWGNLHAKTCGEAGKAKVNLGAIQPPCSKRTWLAAFCDTGQKIQSDTCQSLGFGRLWTPSTRRRPLMQGTARAQHWHLARSKSLLQASTTQCDYRLSKTCTDKVFGSLNLC